MIRWHNWNCDHVGFTEEPYPNMAYGFPRGTMPKVILVKMFLNFRINYFTYMATWIVPFKGKCRKE